MTKRICSLLLALCLCLSMVPPVPVARAMTSTSGRLTDSIDWALDGTGALILTGTGEIPDYIDMSWSAWADEIQHIQIGEGITRIGEMAFSELISLRSVSLPEGLTEIASAAFWGSEQLKSITLPSTVSIVSYNAFECGGLEEFRLAEGSEAFSVADGVLYSRDGTKLVSYPLAKPDAEFRIPDGVTTISQWAFFIPTALEKLIIPASVTCFEEIAISESPYLTSVGPVGSGCAIEYEWTDLIPQGFMRYCCLEKVIIADTITALGEEAFCGGDVEEVYYGLDEGSYWQIEGIEQLEVDPECIFFGTVPEPQPPVTEPEETEPTEPQPTVTEPEETEPVETEPVETEPPVTEPPVTEPDEHRPSIDWPVSNPNDITFYPLAVGVPTMAMDQQYFVEPVFYYVRCFFRFVPPRTASYRFTAHAFRDTWINIYDAGGRQVASGDESMDGNFDLTTQLQGGHYYFVEVWINGASRDNLFQAYFKPFPILVEEVHPWETTLITPHTCTTDGVLDAVCPDCGYRTQLPVPASHSFADGVCTVCGTDTMAQGTLTDSITWHLDGRGKLTVSGEGSIPDYPRSRQVEGCLPPWQPYAELVTSIVVEDGIRDLGDHCFWFLYNATGISLPDTLKTLGENCMLGCIALEQITIPANVTRIDTPLHAPILRFEGPAPDCCDDTFLMINGDALELLYHGDLDGWDLRLHSGDRFNQYIFVTDRLLVNLDTGITPEEFCFTQKEYRVELGQSVTPETNHPETAEACLMYGSLTCSGAENLIIDGFNILPTTPGTYDVELQSICGAYRTRCRIVCTSPSFQPTRALPVDGIPGDNLSRNTYQVYDSPRISHLNQLPDGTLERVQWIEGTGLVITCWNSDLELVSQQTLEPELPLFGGYYTDGEYRYLLYGQENPAHRTDAEVFLVIRYSMDWQQVDHCSVSGTNISLPFYQGSADMVADSGTLYVHTCGQTFPDAGGDTHQVSVTFRISLDGMTLEQLLTPAVPGESDLSRWTLTNAYSQRILIHNGLLYRADRCLIDIRTIGLYRQTPGVLDDQGEYWVGNQLSRYGIELDAGVSLGNMASMEDHLLIGFNSIAPGDQSYDTRNIYLVVRNDLWAENYWYEVPELQITSYFKDDPVQVGVPQLIPVTPRIALLLWEQTYTDAGYTRTAGCLVLQDGTLLSEVVEMDARLSDCLPIVTEEGSVVWYVSDGEGITLYSLDWRRLMEDPVQTDGLLPHSFRSVIIPPTCIEEGRTVHTCEHCGYSYEDTFTDLIAHDYAPVVTEPQCLQKGYTTHTCTFCGDSYTDSETEPLGHDWQFSCTVLPATCAEPGEDLWLCSRCDAEERRATPHLEHIYEISEILEPGCETSGCTVHTCKLCQDSYRDAYVSPLGHDMGDWYETDNATCLHAGEERRDCSRCDWHETRDIPATGHQYQQIQVEPSCLQEGYILFQCTGCSSSYTGDTLPALGHSYEEGLCIRCGAEDPDYVSVNPFTDVQDADYFYGPVMWAVAQKITSGTSATTFAPNATCTRGQVVTFLWRAMGQPEPQSTANPFSDVTESDYFYKAVLWAVEQQITAGTGNGQFSPNRPCTRDQVVTFLWRTLGKPEAENRNNPFTDVAETAYYYEPVLWAVENGITAGTSAVTFAPSNPCTRGQVVTFLYRALAR